MGWTFQCFLRFPFFRFLFVVHIWLLCENLNSISPVSASSVKVLMISATASNSTLYWFLYFTKMDHVLGCYIPSRESERPAILFCSSESMLTDLRSFYHNCVILHYIYWIPSQFYHHTSSLCTIKIIWSHTYAHNFSFKPALDTFMPPYSHTVYRENCYNCKHSVWRKQKWIRVYV